MDADDIRAAFAYAEDATARDLFPVELPRMAPAAGEGPGRVVSRIVIGGEGAGPCDVTGSTGQALCIEVRSGRVPAKGEALGRDLHRLLAANPYTLVSWIVPEGLYRGAETLEAVASLCSGIAHTADREYMAAFTPKRSCQLFLRGATAAGRSTYTLVPLEGDRERPLWAGLPPDAGDEEERLLGDRMASLLGYRPVIRCHDLGGDPCDALEEVLCTRVVPAQSHG
jgi:hypothetical protein